MAVDKSFVVKNGLEVNSDLIVADANNKKVGIASTSPRSTLDVRGGIAATDGNFTGILTAASVDISDFGVLNGSGANITGFSTLGGLSVDQLTVTGVATFADLSYDEITGRNLNITGIATVPVFVGLTSFNDGIEVTGISTYAEIDTTNLNISGVGTVATANITTLSNYPNFTGGATVVGTVTAAHFSGGGLGVGIKTSGSVIGYGFTMLNFVGSGNTFAVNGTTVDISIAGGGGGGSGSASIGVGSTPGDAFSGIITAGNLWYNTGLGRLFIYYQDDNSAQWVDAAPFNVGIITTLTNVSFDAGSVSSPAISFGSDSDSGFFSPTDGSVTVSSNGVGVVTFNASGVNVNGVVTATSFSGDGSGLTGVASTDNIQTATAAKFLSDVSISGVTTVGVVTGGTSVSATHFYGDGSALTGIDATAIKDSDGNVKAQANPNGIEITGILTGSTANFTGVTTISNVIVGGATTELIVEGDARITGILTIGTSSITLDGANNTVNVGTAVTLDASAGTVKATTFVGDGSQLTGAGVGTESNVNTSGIITATRFVGSGTSLRFAPKIIAFNPLALQQNVAAGSSIHITFDQNIHFVGSGDVVIREGSSDGTGIQTFSISSGAGPSGLSIVDTQLIIEPSSDFNLGTSIYVTLPSSGIANTEGDFFAGSSNYNFRTVEQTFSAQGGDYVYTINDPGSPTNYYKYHIFTTTTSTGILTTSAPSASAADLMFMMVAGGGCGSEKVLSDNLAGAGGGAGGVITKTGPALAITAGSYPIGVGTGGHPANSPHTGNPGRGGDTTFSSPTAVLLTAFGGGAGAQNGTWPDVDTPRFGQPGGSGGGAMVPPESNAGTGYAGQGNPGGGYNTTYPYAGAGGGGGAGAAGGTAQHPGSPTGVRTGGAGGVGQAVPAFKSPVLSGYVPVYSGDALSSIGPNGYYGGGGGGAANGPTSLTAPGPGGSGGGGNSGSYGPGVYAQVGANGTGGGGGGRGNNPTPPTIPTYVRGGSGVVMIRYNTPAP